MAVTDAGSDKATAGITNGSMAGGNTQSSGLSFQPPGGETEQTAATVAREIVNPVPTTKDANIPGLGERGGLDDGAGANPASGHHWEDCSAAGARDSSRWTTARQPVRNESDD